MPNPNFDAIAVRTPDPIVQRSQEYPAHSILHENAANQTIGTNVSISDGLPDRPDFVLEALDTASAQINARREFGYKSPVGDMGFLDAFGRLLLGEERFDAYRDEILRYQTSGGTNALSVTAKLLSEFVRRDDTGRIPMLIQPGYANHLALFPPETFNVSAYQHVNPENNEYNHQAALDAIAAAPEYSVALFQVCGHNDTGLDPSEEQWDEILDAVQARNLVLVLDAAYIGLAKGVKRDIYPIVRAHERGILTFVDASCSKILGLYDERLGAVEVLNARQVLGDDQYARLDAAHRANVRATNTGYPTLVARQAAIALEDPRFLPWLEKTRLRNEANRVAFCSAVGEIALHMVNGHGLFGRLLYGGYSEREEQALRDEGILVLDSSRVNYGGMKDPEYAAELGRRFVRALLAAAG